MLLDVVCILPIDQRTLLLLPWSVSPPTIVLRILHRRYKQSELIYILLINYSWRKSKISGVCAIYFQLVTYRLYMIGHYNVFIYLASTFWTTHCIQFRVWIWYFYIWNLLPAFYYKIIDFATGRWHRLREKKINTYLFPRTPKRKMNVMRYWQRGLRYIYQ